MRPLRPLLPAKRGLEKSKPAPTEAPLKKRNTLACDSCRGKRIKVTAHHWVPIYAYLTRAQCNGARPTCEACSQRSLTCHYHDRKSRSSSDDDVAKKRELTVQTFLMLIRSANEDHAIGIFRSLRAGASIEAIVSQYELGEGDAIPQLSYDTVNTPGALTAATSFLCEPSLADFGTTASPPLLHGEYYHLAKREETLQKILDLLRCALGA